MMTTACASFASVLSILLVGAGAAEKCVCKESILRGGWCELCRVGHVAAVRIESEDLFEALDAHGHDINPERISCASCQAALKSDGYCEVSGMGFVKKQAYLSRLTYHLALGGVTEVASVTCQTCKGMAGKHGWCDACQRGWIGFVSIGKKGDYDQAAAAYGILVEAAKAVLRCEICAIAMVTNARCLSCKVSYKDGRRVESPAAGSLIGTSVEKR